MTEIPDCPVGVRAESTHRELRTPIGRVPGRSERCSPANATCPSHNEREASLRCRGLALLRRQKSAGPAVAVVERVGRTRGYRREETRVQKIRSSAWYARTP